MLTPLICGSFSHRHLQEEEGDDHTRSPSPCSTPRKSSRKSSKEKNPYSSLGLDKFSALLADLEEKRQKIYSQVGSQDITLVRFVYSGSNDCVPVIVKVKDQSKPNNLKKNIEANEEIITVDNSNNAEPLSESSALYQEHKQRLELEKKIVKSCIWDLKLHKFRRPSVYMPVFIILILLLLAFFGRSMTILCTTIGWYSVPTLSSRRPEKASAKKKKKKQLFRRYSEIAPRTNHLGDVKDNSIHGRQNSF